MKSNSEQENPRQLKLTDANVARLRAPTASGKPQITWDTDIKGLGVLCGGTGATKTYVVRFTVKGQAKRPRLKLGWTSTTTLAEAKRKARDYINQGVAGVNPKDEERKKARAAKGDSLDSVLTRYAEDCRALGKIAEGSIEQNEGNIRRHLEDWLSLPLKAITEQMVLERHAELPAIIAKARTRATGHCQANHVMRSLRTVFNHAAELDEGLGRNPVEVLGRRDRWYPENKRTDYVAAHQMEMFWAAVEALPNDMHRDILIFTLLTGLRRKNVFSLRWKQIDFAAKAIRFEPHQMKSRRRHELPMSDYLCALMQKRAAVGNADWVWPTDPTRKGPGHVINVRKSIATASKAAGVVWETEDGTSVLSVHGLRRTFATLGRQGGVGYDEISRLLDHSQASITGSYIQTDVESLRAPMQRVTDHILALAGINITDPEKIPERYEDLEAAYVRRFGSVTFDAKSAGRELSYDLMTNAMLRMRPVTELELARRKKLARAS